MAKRKTAKGPGVRYSADQLRNLPTLSIGQADDLKIDTPDFRVWLSRCSVEDGEPYNDKITVECRIRGQWIVTETYPGTVDELELDAERKDHAPVPPEHDGT